MKIKYILLIAVLFSSHLSCSQDSKIISKELFVLPDSVSTRIAVRDTVFSRQLRGVDYYRIVYLSDGLKVVAYLAQPKEKVNIPASFQTGEATGILVNGTPWVQLLILEEWQAGIMLLSLVNTEGTMVEKEDFGGKDINDVLNLIPVLSQLPKADTSKIGIEGGSRGGMMTYLAM